MKTRVTELLQINYPVVQGGLAYLAYAELAAAVSNAGGLGQITAMSLPSAEALREEIRKVRTMTDRPFGVNFAIGQYNQSYEPYVDVAIEEGVKVISVTGATRNRSSESSMDTISKSWCWLHPFGKRKKQSRSGRMQ